MRRGSDRVRATRIALCAVLAVALGLAGCASLPSSSAPQIIGTLAPSATQLSVPTPVPQQEPDLLVRDFLKAGALADQRHAASRQFLTPAAAEAWDDSPSTTIVLRADLSAAGGRTDSRASYVLRAEKVGTLDPGGIYREESGQYEATLDLVRVDGQWRIDKLPAGVVLERTEFFSTYAQRDLYFLSASGDRLVPDARWTAAYKSDLEFALVNLLAPGPRAELAPGVESRVPQSASVRPTSKEDDPQAQGITIDFQGLPAMSSQAVTEFAAQVVWTLAGAGVSGPYRLEREGSPIDERHSGGWTTTDVQSFDPYVQTETMKFALTAADGLVQIDAGGARPAGGAWSALRGGQSGALSRDQRNLAVVTNAGDANSAADQAGSAAMHLGPLDGRPSQVLAGRTLTPPTFDPIDGAVWTVVDGVRIARVTPATDRVQVDEVAFDTMRVLGERISDLRLDPTGSRVAVVAGGNVYVGTVDRKSARMAVTAFRQIGRNLDNTATTISWKDRSTLVVGRRLTEAPVVTLSVDGALTEPLSQRNITAPIATVAAASSEVYVVDQRSLLRLDTRAETGSRYWRELSGLAAIRANPIVAG